MMYAALAVIVYIAMILGCVWYWFGDNAKRAPKWLLEDAPHEKYDEMD